MKGPAAPGSGDESPRALAWAGSGPEAWGGTQIEWVDPQNPRATLFALDDAIEEEWRGLHAMLRGVAHALNNALRTLSDTAQIG